jgi:ribosomal protein S18 acetylase RimI-like enzyme
MALDGIRIRSAEPADADAIARVQAATWQAAYLGMLPHEILAAFGQAQGGAFWERVLVKAPTESVLVAELEQQMLGFVSAGPIRQRIPGYDGEFYALYVLPEAQGCGIGTALVAHAARALVRQRWLGAAVWVLEDNHLGRRFYERLDGRPLGIAKTLAYRGNAYPNIREMAYGWPDLRRAPWLVDEPNRR